MQVIESSGRGERAYDIYSRLLKERIICVNGPIDDSTSNVIVAQLLYLESQHPEQKVCLPMQPTLSVAGTYALSQYNLVYVLPLSLLPSTADIHVHQLTRRCRDSWAGHL